MSESKRRVVDLRSDTVTKPTHAMRKAMAEAEVGDDVYGEDPTVLKLEQRVAKLFGKEAALFIPSGTMGNLLAIMVHCGRRGSEAIAGHLSHIQLYEQGGAAQIAGVSLTQIENKPDGTFSLEKLKTMMRGYDVHETITTLVLVENTHNICGGKVLPLNWLDELAVIVKENNLKIHMDGARIFNAAEYLNVPASRLVQDVDSVCCCLSKGLSCPVGSILIGNKDFITEAHRLRKVLGGGMRQVGVLAAAGLVALDEIVPKLKFDHNRTQRLAKAIHDINSPNFDVNIQLVQTNIFMIDLKSKSLRATDLADRLIIVTDEELKAGIVDQNGNGIIVKTGARDWPFVRAVIHSDIDDEFIELAIKKIVYVIKEFDKKIKD